MFIQSVEITMSASPSTSLFQEMNQALIREKNRVAQRKWVLKNKERNKARCNKYYKENRAKILAKKKEVYQKKRLHLENLKQENQLLKKVLSATAVAVINLSH
jgi:hypothetical protein